jgi:hypothetical protein
MLERSPWVTGLRIDHNPARDTAEWFTKTKPDFDFGAKSGAAGLRRAREAERRKAWADRPKP